MTLDHMKMQLERDLDSVKSDIEEASKNATTVMLDQSSVGRLSRMDALQQQAMAQELLKRLHIKKIKIESALKRFELGVYGLCCQCDAPLTESELMQDLTLLFCEECRKERSAPQ